MKALLSLLLAGLMATLAGLSPSRGAEIAIALTDDEVKVDAGFSGARLTLFGAVTGVENPAENVDIIAVIQGPETQFQIRQFKKHNLIWVAGDAHSVESAPSLYLSAATNAVTDIAPLPDQYALALHTDHISAAIAPADGETELSEEILRAAFLSEAEEQGLYRNSAGDVTFQKGALFTVRANLPANTPVGDYSVAVYLYQDGVLLGEDNAALTVHKVGLERRIYELAHNQPVSYGVLCVALSLFAGWIAGLAFRK